MQFPVEHGFNINNHQNIRVKEGILSKASKMFGKTMSGMRSDELLLMGVFLIALSFMTYFSDLFLTDNSVQKSWAWSHEKKFASRLSYTFFKKGILSNSSPGFKKFFQRFSLHFACFHSLSVPSLCLTIFTRITDLIHGMNLILHITDNSIKNQFLNCNLF